MRLLVRDTIATRSSAHALEIRKGNAIGEVSMITMNRRQILAGAIGTSGMLTFFGTGRRTSRSLAHREPPFAERSFRNASGDAASPGITFLRCRVERHRGEDLTMEAFERHYADATTPEDDAEFAEISYSGAVEHPLPRDLIVVPYRFATYTTVAGAAAFEADHAVGVVRRGTVVWLYVAQGHGAAEIADTVGEIAAAMPEREISVVGVTIDELGQHRGGLWDLLPTLDDVPAGLILDAEVSPDGRFNALGTPIPTPDS